MSERMSLFLDQSPGWVHVRADFRDTLVSVLPPYQASEWPLPPGQLMVMGDQFVIDHHWKLYIFTSTHDDDNVDDGDGA
jgi:hypothetical protein